MEQLTPEKIKERLTEKARARNERQREKECIKYANTRYLFEAQVEKTAVFKDWRTASDDEPKNEKTTPEKMEYWDRVYSYEKRKNDSRVKTIEIKTKLDIKMKNGKKIEEIEAKF